MQVDSNPPPLNLLTNTQQFSQTGLFKWLSCVASTYLYGAFDIRATIECGFTLKTRTWRDKNIQSDRPWFLIFFLYFTENWMKLSQYTFSTIALGKKYKCFSYWTSNKRSLLWLVYPSFITMVAFCSVSVTCPPVKDLVLLKNSSKQI